MIWLAIIGIPGLILWMISISILYKNKAKVNCYYIFLLDLVALWRIIKIEESKDKRNKYFILFWLQIALIVIYFTGVFTMLEYNWPPFN